MENKRSLRDKSSFRAAVLLALAGMCIVAFLLGNSMGTLKIPFDRVVTLLFHGDGSMEWKALWNIRLPRMILAGLVGVNLALSGAILQGVMGNPLADPGIIGISSGAGLFGIFILVVLPQYVALVPVFAFLGAMLAAVIIYTLAWKGASSPRGSFWPALRCPRCSVPGSPGRWSFSLTGSTAR